MIERQIITGLIISTEFTQQIRESWNNDLMESKSAKLLADWCWEYFEKYNVAPGKDIEGIFYQKSEDGLGQEVSEDIEEILTGLSREYKRNRFNLKYLLDQTHKHFRDRRLQLHSEQIKALLSRGEIDQAENLATSYRLMMAGSNTDLNLSHPSVLERVANAFNNTAQPVVTYPRQLGVFWNAQLVRGALVAFMAPEKRGKTFWLMDVAMRACKQKAKVAFFQAGDMTEEQMLKRLCVYLTGTSDQHRYVGRQWEPMRDCVNNQLNKCTHPDRESDFGVFEELGEKELRDVGMEDLQERYRTNPNYKPCWNCKKYWRNKWGTPWVQEVDIQGPLEVEKAQQAVSRFFIEHNRNFRLSSHSNGTLTVTHIKSILSVWEKTDGFVPDLIVIDYADLLVPEVKTEFRHQQNEIWKGLRSLSQERYCLVVTATQTDADSYGKNRLKLQNFSEDKRKYAHVTAMYGLNQDVKNREKQIGLMRINEIVVREGDFSNDHEVTVLQNLRRGRPFLGSFFG